MSTIMTSDGIKIAYKDWSKGQPILFLHGWAACRSGLPA
jgi:non-heme chloroperoxidase